MIYCRASDVAGTHYDNIEYLKNRKLYQESLLALREEVKEIEAITIVEDRQKDHNHDA